jgi:tRNA pseudouridine65 synthase
VSHVLASVQSAMAAPPLVTAASAPLPILYRDEALLIVDKPSGLAAHRGYSSEHGDYLLTRARDSVGQHVFLAHRLDRATSGAVALTFRPELAAALQVSFEAGAVYKRYLALVRGHLKQSCLVDYPIARRDGKDAPKVNAQTRFVPLVELERYTLVEAEPITGRYHQIRRHLKHLRHPIVGDTTYGDGKQNRIVRERFGLLRLFLHASKLSLPHPLSGHRIEVEAPLPEELRRTLDALGHPVSLARGPACETELEKSESCERDVR